MINSVNFRNYRTSESVQFFTNLASLCVRNNAGDMGLADQVADLTKVTQKLNDNFKVDVGSDKTGTLMRLDDRRDEGFYTLKLVAEGFTHHFDPAKANAAQSILKRIDKYDSNVPRLGYQPATSTYNNLCKELIQEPASADVEALELTDVVNEIIDANTTFSDIYLGRLEENASKTDISLGEYIKEAIASYRIFVTHLTAHVTLKPDELGVFVKQVNELIDASNKAVDSRGSRSDD